MMRNWQKTGWAADDHNWLPIKEVARLEGMTLTEFYDYLYKLDQGGVWVIQRHDVDHQVEIYIGAKYAEFGDYYRLTPDAARRRHAERKIQQETVVYLQNMLRALGMNTTGLPHARHFAVHPNLIATRAGEKPLCEK